MFPARIFDIILDFDRSRTKDKTEGEKWKTDSWYRLLRRSIIIIIILVDKWKEAA